MSVRDSPTGQVTRGTLAASFRLWIRTSGPDTLIVLKSNTSKRMFRLVDIRFAFRGTCDNVCQ